MSPGIKTTELWVTVVSQLLAAVVVSINMIYGKQLDINVYTQVVATGGAFASSIMTAIWYTRSRASVKMAETNIEVRQQYMQQQRGATLQ